MEEGEEDEGQENEEEVPKIEISTVKLGVNRLWEIHCILILIKKKQ